MDGQPQAQKKLDEREVRAIIGGIVLAMFLGALEPDHRRHSAADDRARARNAELIPWVITGYLISATAVTPLYGKFSDIHGGASRS